MKKYKVLEAHQGDKFYQPGDGDTGTRIADPNAVGHLVTLGLLEEIGDVVADEPVEQFGASVASLQAQVAALMQERDGALADLTALGSTHAAAQNAAASLRDQVEALLTERDNVRAELTTVTGERDGLREQLTTATGDRDGLREQLTTATGERDGLREQLTTVTGERDAHGQRVTALEGELATANAAPPARAHRAKPE